MACAIRSVSFPSGLPGNTLLIPTPSKGLLLVLLRFSHLSLNWNAGMFMTGMVMNRPLSLSGSMSWYSLDAYSTPQY